MFILNIQCIKEKGICQNIKNKLNNNNNIELNNNVYK